jgi:hypothetical protein
MSNSSDYSLSNQSGASFRSELNTILGDVQSSNSGTGAPSTLVAYKKWIDTNTPSATYNDEFIYDGTDNIGMGRVDVTNNRYIPYNAAHGQCRLTKSGSNLLLSPYDGNVIIINGAPEVIPSAGVTLAPSGVSNNTTYYIYAYMSGTTMTLEYSATTYVTDTTTGVVVKNGDATRTLVGMARSDGSAAWQDTAAARGVLSWFNRLPIVASATDANDRTVSSTSFAAITQLTINFLAWTGDAVTAATGGIVSNSGGDEHAYTGIGFDSNTPESGYTVGRVGSTFIGPASCTVIKSGLSEGWHDARYCVRTNSGVAVLYAGSSVTPQALRLSVNG